MSANDRTWTPLLSNETSLLMWHYFNDAGQGLMIAGIVRHLGLDLHLCDTWLSGDIPPHDITHVTVTRVVLGLICDQLTPWYRGELDTLWYTLISETVRAHVMVLIISLSLWLTVTWAGAGAGRGRMLALGQQENWDITIRSRYLFANSLQIGLTSLDSLSGTQIGH